MVIRALYRAGVLQHFYPIGERVRVILLYFNITMVFRSLTLHTRARAVELERVTMTLTKLLGDFKKVTADPFETRQ